VLLAVGIDPNEYSGFAFGFGIDRCAQMRHQIPDMRALTDNDQRFLEQFS
jgi:phenylalanyl-tRNA synthetase alpha chain